MQNEEKKNVNSQERERERIITKATFEDWQDNLTKRFDLCKEKEVFLHLPNWMLLKTIILIEILVLVAFFLYTNFGVFIKDMEQIYITTKK